MYPSAHRSNGDGNGEEEDEEGNDSQVLGSAGMDMHVYEFALAGCTSWLGLPSPDCAAPDRMGSTAREQANTLIPPDRHRHRYG